MNLFLVALPVLFQGGIMTTKNSQSVITNNNVLKNQLRPDFPADKVLKFTRAADALLLDVLVTESSLIVTGRVTGILKHSYSPENSNSIMQYTVYQFQVESNLKGECSKIIKLHQPGGPLPWEFLGGKGRGTIHEGDPLYWIGERYLLFLKEPVIGPEDNKRGYFLGSFGNVIGKSGDLDEYHATFPFRAKFLVKNGVLTAPITTGDSRNDHWRFLNGPQILDTNEQQAITEIKSMIKKVDQRNKSK